MRDGKNHGSLPITHECVYMAIGYGAVYIPIELELPKEKRIPRAVQIIGGNSQELSLVVDLGASGNDFYQFDFLVYSYLWQSNLIPNGAVAIIPSER